MSHSHEPSYYEIALTNRQVMVVFVVLLVCVVAAFFSGVWVGRGQEQGTAALASEPAVADGQETQEEGSEIGELHFFSDRDTQAAADSSLADIAQKPQAETTLLEDLGGEEAEPEIPDEPAPKQQASSSTPASTVAPPVSSEAAAAAEAASGYVIQVFSSSDEGQARKLLDQLAAAGYPAFLSPVEVGNQTMMRVRIGPFSDLKEAESVAERIRREFKLDTWVTR